MAAEQQSPDRLESARIPAEPFVLMIAGVVGFLIVSTIALWSVFAYSVPNRTPLPAETAPPPLLLSDPNSEREAVTNQQTARLAGYRWIDRAQKIAAIPIERAMAIIAARGAKAYAPIETVPGAGQTPPPATKQPPGAPQ